MSNNGLHLVNGNINEDEESDLIFVRGVGYSAVDYVITNAEGE